MDEVLHFLFRPNKLNCLDTLKMVFNCPLFQLFQGNQLIPFIFLLMLKGPLLKMYSKSISIPF